jgi:hypothetical protein
LGVLKVEGVEVAVAEDEVNQRPALPPVERNSRQVKAIAKDEVIIKTEIWVSNLS